MQLQVLWQNGSETVFGPKNNREWKTLTADKTFYLKTIDEFVAMYSEGLFFKETYL